MHFKFTTAGESHGKALIAIVEGVPSGLPIDIDAIDHELWRRQQGYGRGRRMKIETDTVEILSGVRHGRSLGSPIALMIKNDDFVHWEDVMSVESVHTQSGSSPLVSKGSATDTDDSTETKSTKNTREVKRPRPGHADLPGGQKYETRDLRDILERASARETAARVACGAIAKQLLAAFGVEIKSHVIKLGHVQIVPLNQSWEAISAIPIDSQLRCADDDIQREMIKLIDQAKTDGDTLGGIFEVVAKDLPVGLGSHISWEDKLDGRIARAVMSIHAIKAVEIGEGVANAGRRGSEVHDEIFFGNSDEGQGTREKGAEPLSSSLTGGFRRSSNRAGGLEGGITNGEELRVRAYMKPISTLRNPLHSVDIDTKEQSDAAFERSDITAVPAAGVIGEAMLAIVIANEMREKFGGDSINEMKRNFDSYIETIEQY